MVVVDKRVLVVDDEEIVRNSCKRALTDAGYAVRTAGSGRDALKLFRDEPFDVMLTDLKMPDMDGFDVIQAVTKEFPEVRVVIITGYPSRESADRAEKLGIFDYLEKPLSPGRLSAATAEALSPSPVCAPVDVPPAATNPDVSKSDMSTSDVAVAIEAESPQSEEAPATFSASPDDSVPDSSATVPVEVELRRSEDIAPREAEGAEVSTLKALALLAVAPVVGLAYVMFLPFIGFGMLLSVLGMGLASKLGWVQR